MQLHMPLIILINVVSGFTWLLQQTGAEWNEGCCNIYVNSSTVKTITAKPTPKTHSPSPLNTPMLRRLDPTSSSDAGRWLLFLLQAGVNFLSCPEGKTGNIHFRLLCATTDTWVELTIHVSDHLAPLLDHLTPTSPEAAVRRCLQLFLQITHTVAEETLWRVWALKTASVSCSESPQVLYLYATAGAKQREMTLERNDGVTVLEMSHFHNALLNFPSY